MTEFISLIQTLGFPIFVAVYLLVFMHKTLESNREALLSLRDSQDLLRKDMKEIREIVTKCHIKKESA